MSISSPGIGSGLDVSSIVSQLVELERRPITILQAQKTKLSTQLSSFGLLQSYMANLQSAAGVIAKPDFWTKNVATTTDPASVGVSAKATAVPGSYSIDVLSLATAQSLSTGAGVITDASNMGAGTVTITRGTTAVPITIADGSSLASVRDQINAAKAGVTAAIIQDTTGPRLVLSGVDTGAANAVSIAVTGASGQLTALSYPAGMTQDRPAADAVLKINGLQISSPKNTLSGVVDGLNLTLSKVTTSAVQVTVGNDTASLKKGISDFVSAFNDISKYLSAQTKYDEATKVAGALQGDRSAVGLQNRLRSVLQQTSPASEAYDRLGDLGLELQRDGTIKLDNAKLDAAMADPAEVARAFSTLQTGFGQRFKALADSVLGTDGLMSTRTSGLRDSIARNDKDQQRLEDRVARVQARLLKQYSALDTSLNQLNGLGSFVQQQITNWNKSRSDY
ncbi:MAG: flagellar filament capping protein FliD [Pseudomonadota bacterium]